MRRGCTTFSQSTLECKYCREAWGVRIEPAWKILLDSVTFALAANRFAAGGIRVMRCSFGRVIRGRLLGTLALGANDEVCGSDDAHDLLSNLLHLMGSADRP
jgi:hypothetical protein